MSESATIEVWAEDVEGPADGLHMLELTAVGRAADGSFRTSGDAVGGETAQAGAVRSCTGGDGMATVDAPHLVRVLAGAYPRARVSFHLACGGTRPLGKQPRLLRHEVSVGRCG